MVIFSQELIDIKLTKEEDNTDARSRRSRHFRTNSGETKKKAVKKDDEDLDFEPESDHEAEMDQVDENKGDFYCISCGVLHLVMHRGHVQCPCGVFTSYLNITTI